VAGFVPGSSAAGDTALLTSELVTNAILHSASGLRGGQVTVSVRTQDGIVRVDVTDQGELPPCFPRDHGLGQGLAIVAALADVFGADGNAEPSLGTTEPGAELPGERTRRTPADRSARPQRAPARLR
jgi:two-component sensor histidine kinase